MTRKVLTFFLLSLFVVFMASTAFASKAANANRGIDPSQLRPIKDMPLAGTPENDAWLARQGANGTALGAFGPEDNFVGYKIGSTSYDYQHNGSMGRNIAQGADGRIHFAWMHKQGSNGTREVYYNSALFGSGVWGLSHDTSGTSVSGANGGYCNVGVWGSLGVPCWHEGPTENTYSIYTGIDFSSGAASFTTSAAPVGATCSGATTNGSDGPGNYLWPVPAVDVGFASDPVIHAVGHESTTETEQSFVYFRGVGNPTNWGTCGIFVDSVTDIAGIVRQDPNSNEVTIVWVKPRDYGPDENQYDNDIFYVKSSDGGVTWGTPQNLTNHVTDDQERPYCNVSAIYTDDGCLHIAWDSPGYFASDGTISIAPCKMYHWDDCNNCKSLIIDADNAQTCAPGAWNRNVTKMNLTECAGKLYVVYTYFTGDTDLGTTDCSTGGWANGEIYAQCSSTGGVTWGPPINLTNTPSDGCAAGNCTSEQWSSTVMYADSLYTFYVGDLDAGGIPQDEGTWTDNPMMFMVNPCFDMATYVDLSATPNRFYYPINVAPGGSLDTTFVLQNAGNTSATWNTSVTGASIVGSVSPSSGSVPAGCTNSSTVNLTLNGPATEGLYEATIHVNFSKAVQDVDVELYVFDPFCLPEHVRLRTNANLLDVAQNSRAANQKGDAGFAWFADTTNYLFDASLIIGNTSTGQWDFDMFHTLSDEPTATNPWGRLYTTDCTPFVDTTLGGVTYRKMTGTGVNHDSTIGFTTEWYASGHPDSNSFYVGHFTLGPGPKFSGDISNLVIAFGADWDIPSDTLSDNLGNVDDSLECVYQSGLYVGSPNGNDLREGGMIFRDAGGIDSASGGVVWDNPRFVYPANGYHVDTLQNHLPNINTWFKDIPDSSAMGEDLNSIVVVDNNATISSAKSTNPEFNIILYAINPNENPSATRESIALKAEAFICSYVSSSASYCGGGVCGPDFHNNCTPADANGDGTRNITDAVVIIQWIFAGGADPKPWSTCSADANGDCTANITDAVVIIQWIFAGGTPPVSCETWSGNCTDPGDFTGPSK